MRRRSERIAIRRKSGAEALSRRANEYEKLVAEVAEAELKADRHDKLDKLLGKGGLQRRLVRSAEREIVRLAKDTVQNLSDGDLAVELEDSTDGGDEAFALRVRRADDPTPIGVNYLSGSQKFRVAIVGGPGDRPLRRGPGPAAGERHHRRRVRQPGPGRTSGCWRTS